MKTLHDAVKECLIRPVEEKDGALEALFRFPADFAGFSGHFPGDPILPGVAQIMAGVFTAASGEPWRLLRVKRCKFSRIVLPDENVLVRATNSKKDGLVQSSIQLSVEGEVCALISVFLDQDAS